MAQRRYNEAEITAIFERATRALQAGPGETSPAEGMTLAELQEIGREIGISPGSIALAAQVVGQATLPASRTFLGFPIGVERTIELDRQLSEEEWERFVVDLRETFGARGSMKGQGALRQWTNGNLQALLEPTPTGHRIRLRTIKGEAVSMLGGGLGMLGLSAAGLVAATVQGALVDVGMLAAIGSLGVAGAGLLATSALRLPRWARTRHHQMEEVAARVALTASSLPGSD